MRKTTNLRINPMFAEHDLPKIVTPIVGGRLSDYLQDAHQVVEEELLRVGGVLFRGFDTIGEEQFQEFARSFGSPLLNYEFASTPRTDLGDGVYTTTEYPAHQQIPLHNEQAYTLNWPMKIWFHCITPAETEGETPIADSRLIYNKIDPKIRQHFDSKKLKYVRNYGNGLDLPWEKVFGTKDKKQVERFCLANKINFEWNLDGDLRTSQVCQAVAQHPKTHEMVWFNQAHLFHISNLEANIREVLLSVVDEEDLPRNVYYGDGSPIEDSILAEIRGVLDECTIKFPWQAGDILMLDNMLVAHSRSRFTGARKVVVAMAEGNI
ncbi:TauD/TfdA family dioxygenase [Moritella yayanosii]|uniref:Pyoverdine biosynthesis regulatory protein n=1 Tax=Moritella yayanosii TaxID=69539 RepID=A0A330LJ59_9GAMM|nr:TauD/TfdA family dioxygenase [Moritella yayanosii]SQD76619.1 Pyoverdine biosynthesis regulatory protein [Moritella yayanosii]